MQINLSKETLAFAGTLINPTLGESMLNTLSRDEATLRRILGTHYDLVIGAVEKAKGVITVNPQAPVAGPSTLGKNKELHDTGDSLPPAKKQKVGARS